MATSSRFLIDQVTGFARLQRDTLVDFEAETLPGVLLGQRWIPVASCGAYSPGGYYPLIASAVMTIAVAKVAKVGRVLAAAPPRNGHGIHPPQLWAMVHSGADGIFVLGGVPALALMAFGLEGSEPVDILCGAGNKYVAEAKRQLFGRCGIDLLAGPTEILVIADDAADPIAGGLRPARPGRARPEQRRSALICLARSSAGPRCARSSASSRTCRPRDIAAVSWRDNGDRHRARGPTRSRRRVTDD